MLVTALRYTIARRCHQAGWQRTGPVDV